MIRYAFSIAWVLFDEPITPTTLAGMALTALVVRPPAGQTS